jgi:hypothetical protein
MAEKREHEDETLIRQEDDKAKPKADSRAEKDRQAKVDELRDLQIEEAHERLRTKRTRKIDREAKQKAMQDQLAANNVQREAQASACTHRKGGKVGLSGGMQALTAGNSENYSVVKHTLPAGEIIVICQRCPKEWHKPDAALAKDRDAEVRAQYKLDMAEYLQALRFPTDNEPSGTQMFLVQRAA